MGYVPGFVSGLLLAGCILELMAGISADYATIAGFACGVLVMCGVKKSAESYSFAQGRVEVGGLDDSTAPADVEDSRGNMRVVSYGSTRNSRGSRTPNGHSSLNHSGASNSERAGLLNTSNASDISLTHITDDENTGFCEQNAQALAFLSADVAIYGLVMGIAATSAQEGTGHVRSGLLVVVAITAELIYLVWLACQELARSWMQRTGTVKCSAV